MSKFTIAVVAGVTVICFFGVGIVTFFLSKTDTTVSVPTATTTPQELPVFDAKNSSFMVNKDLITLSNGISIQIATSGPAATTTTQYFGNEARGDLNGDGFEDVAFLITQNMGGSGTFFYAVAAIKDSTGYKMTNAFLVGDRIAPQPTEINSSAHELLINFAERKPGEPMTTQPSMGATLLLKVTPAGVLEGLMK